MRRKYFDPRLDILLRVPVNWPDCHSVGSRPQDAANCFADLNEETEPISEGITAAA